MLYGKVSRKASLVNSSDLSMMAKIVFDVLRDLWYNP